MAEADGIQEGDPQRGASVIRQVLDASDAPLRLPLGVEAAVHLDVSPHTLRYYERARSSVAILSRTGSVRPCRSSPTSAPPADELRRQLARPSPS